MLELKDLLKKHDRAYMAGQVTRERASDDLVFYHITQWDDNLLEDTNLLFRGQFDILRKAGRQILSDLATNPIQVDFKPKDETREDGAEVLDGLYRADDRRNESIEAYGYAAQDAVVAGFGAWELYTKYATNQVGDLNQVIRRRFIPEAVNTVFWDPNAKRGDKSDAKYVSVLTAYSPEGYCDLVEELTGERPEECDVMSSFKNPEQSYAFPWAGGGEAPKIYVVSFYHTEKVKDKVLTLVDPVGDQQLVLESQLTDHMDQLMDAGYSIEGEKKIERNQVTRYVASGREIIETNVIAGQYIPIIPVYGERAIVEGEEHYEGITRLAKDPQRLRNFQMSYLADIVSKSPRQKPIFLPEQIQGFESMYDIAGADNDYPYLLQNFMDANGQQLPIGPVAVMPEQPMPQALGMMIELTRQAVEDVANPGLPQDIADPDVSGKAVIALQNRMDKQSYVYQHNLKHAKRRDGEVYASMATVVYDAPRHVQLERADGEMVHDQIMKVVTDEKTGEQRAINDLTNMEFDVYSDIGQSYSSQKESTIESLSEMAAAVQMTDPVLHKAIILKMLELTEGVNTDDLREYARKQLIMSGFKEPETEEEMAMVQQAQQNQQPDANMMLAQAEDKKGQAAITEAETKRIIAMANMQNEQAKRQVDGFNAETSRMSVQVDAEEAGATINTKKIEAFGKELDNIAKTQQIKSHPSAMSNEQLFNQARGAE